MEHIDILRSVILPYVNFLLFVVAAYFLFRKPVVAMVEKKRGDFEKLMADSQAAKRDAEKKLAEIEQRLGGLGREAELLKRDMVNQATGEARAMVASAQVLAEHLRQEARRIGETELQRARADLRVELAQMARELALKNLYQKLASGEQKNVFQKRLNAIRGLEIQN